MKNLVPVFVFVSLAIAGSSAAPMTSNFEQSSASSSDDWCRENRHDGDRYERACEVRTMTIASPSMLMAETSNGSVSVTGSSRRDVQIQAMVTAQAPTMSEAKEILADVKILTDGGHVQAEGPRRMGGSRSWWVSYRIDAPTKQDVQAESSNGSVNLSSLNGRLRASTSNGSVHATDLGGDVQLNTSNGSLEVTLAGDSWSGSGLEATTANGSLKVNMPRDYNAHLVARTGNGSLNVDRPVTIQGRIGREIDTDLGKGGATLRFRTSNGSLNIRNR